MIVAGFQPRHKQVNLSQKSLSNLSWIQNHILIELTRHGTRRYGDMRPRDVEGNLYAYHLKGLMNDKLIEKNDTHYQLTLKGLQLVSMLSLDTGKMRRQPQILNAIICRNEKNEYLWLRWQREPNMNMVSFPHGMMHYGEGLSEAAARELREKTALQGELAYRGDVYVRCLLSGVLDRHMLVHLFEASNVQNDTAAEISSQVENFWSPLETLQPADFVPGFYEIAQLVDHAGAELVFADIIVDVTG